MNLRDKAYQIAREAQKAAHPNGWNTVELIERGLREVIEECIRITETQTTSDMQIPCPDGKPGCLVYHAVVVPRAKTAYEIATELRALAAPSEEKK